MSERDFIIKNLRYLLIKLVASLPTEAATKTSVKIVTIER